MSKEFAKYTEKIRSMLPFWFQMKKQPNDSLGLQFLNLFGMEFDDIKKIMEYAYRQTKIDSAILPEWKNTLRYEAEIVIPKGTTLNIGRVEEQFTMSGARLAGDADQFLLPENWDLNWIKSIREVKP